LLRADVGRRITSEALRRTNRAERRGEHPFDSSLRSVAEGRLRSSAIIGVAAAVLRKS
jgi:hypothetical protein